MDGWGPDRDGLRTRLLRAQKEYVVGQPVRFRLELKNFGTDNRTFDPQQVDVNASMIVTGPDGKPVSYIGGSFQTCGDFESVEPDHTVVLFRGPDLDFTDQYSFIKPGKYTVQFRGQEERRVPKGPMLPRKKSKFDEAHEVFSRMEAAATPIPPSNAISVELRPGSVPVPMKVPARLVEVVPEGWRVSVNWRVAEVHDGKISPPGWDAAPGTYVLLERGAVYNVDVLRVHIWVAEQKLTWTGKGLAEQSGESGNAAVYLGKAADGHVYWTVPEKAEKEWSEIRAKVKAALGISSPKPGRQRSS